MAPVITSLASFLDTASGTKIVTGTVANGGLIVIVSCATGDTSIGSPTDNATSGTYTSIANANKATNADRLQIHVRDVLMASSGPVVFTFAPGANTGGGLEVFQITGMDTAGLAAVVQEAHEANQAGGAPPTPVMGAAVNANNPVIGAVFNGTNPAGMTPRSSPAYSESIDTGYGSPTTGLETMFINSGETGTSLAWGNNSSAFCDVIVEFLAPVSTSTASFFTMF